MTAAIRQALVKMDQRFPHSKLDRAAVEGYVEDLQDLPEGAVLEAIEAARKSSEFVPTVKTIRELTVEIMGREGGIWVTPEAAWEEALRNARRYGIEGKRDVIRYVGDTPFHDGVEYMEWSSVVIKRAVDVIGWKELCLMPLGGNEERTMYAQFRDAVKSEQGRVKHALVTGIEIPDMNTAIEGPSRDEPKAIGETISGMLNRMSETRENHAAAETQGRSEQGNTKQRTS